MSVTLANTTKYNPRVPFLAIKNDVLGEKYQLSINLVGEKRARSINQSSRGKSYAPNVLSFPLTKSAGEIYITPLVSKREAKKYEHNEREHFIFLFIHGLLHLQGYDHGPKMDRLEELYLKKYR